ncbi:MAG: J domain-containing protein [Methylacidiphilaceae bacterium]|nr:J domain-containing protein [Candidatus Methylacidiphilaceae bacterium]
MLVEEGSIRKEWERRYRRLQQRLGRVRARIHTFLSGERERFHCWTTKHFPRLSREIARVEERLHGLRRLVFEVESMSCLKGQGLALAYRNLLKRRSSRRPSPKPDSRKESQGGCLDWTLRESGEMEERGRRLKRAYRIMARRLHPDVNGVGDGKQLEQWRAVQLAYQAGDLDLLESMCLENDGTLVEGETLSWLAARVSQAEKALARSLQELGNYRKDLAWGCGRGAWEKTAGPKVEAWLRARLAEAKKETQTLENRVRRWKRESERMFRAEQDRERERLPDGNG